MAADPLELRSSVTKDRIVVWHAKSMPT